MRATKEVRSVLFCLFAAASLFGCVLSPKHNDILASKGSTVTVSGYTQMKSDTIRIQCRPYFAGGSWTFIKNVTSSATPINSAKGELYTFNTTMVIPNACWYHWHSQYTAELQFIGGPYGSAGNSFYAVYDQAGISCIGTELGVESSTYVSMMDKCRLKDTSGNAAQSMYIHAHE